MVKWWCEKAARSSKKIWPWHLAKIWPLRAPEVFAYEESGQVVGELAVLFRAPRAATVKAHLQPSDGKGKGRGWCCVWEVFSLGDTQNHQNQSVCFFLWVFCSSLYIMSILLWCFHGLSKLSFPYHFPINPKLTWATSSFLKYRMYRDNTWLHTFVGPRCNGSSMMDLGHFQVVVFMFAHGLNRSMKAYEPPSELAVQAQATIFIHQRTVHEAGQSFRSASQVPKAFCLRKHLDINKH